MKTIFLYIIGFIFLLSSFDTTKAQSVSMSINCPGDVTSGTNFNMNVAYGYSNIIGDITVIINYDATKVTFVDSAGFPYPYILGGSGANSTVTYTFPATGGTNQTGGIQMHFKAVCPQTCFGGTPAIANFSGSISAPNSTTVTTTTCSTNLNVINDWGGYFYNTNYNCKLNQITYTLRINRSSCYKIENPTLTINPSVGTLISTNTGSLSGNTISLGSSLFGSAQIYISFTIQLPCEYTSGPVSMTAVLNGDNCGVYTPNLKTYTTNYTVAAEQTYAFITCSVSNNEVRVNVVNQGELAINANLSTDLPHLNYTSFSHSTNGPSVNGTYITYDCANSSSPSSGFTSTTTATNIPLSSSIKKMNYSISNLQPGKTFTLLFNYSGTSPSCSPTATMPYTSTTTGNYTSIADPNACNCLTNTKNFNDAICSYSTPTENPNISCSNTNMLYDSPPCHRAGETVSVSFQFKNSGNGPLLNGILNLVIPSFLNLDIASVTYDGSNAGISVSPNGVITLPASIAASNVLHTVNFNATVNTSATNGWHYFYPIISGSNYSSDILDCRYGVLICQDPRAEISKLVKGSEDTIFSTDGSGMAGTVATYQITVTNSGNTPISSVEVLDRTPENGDKTIRTCLPRGSNFTALPNGVFNPNSLSTVATYSNSSVGNNSIPSTWTGLPPCNTPGSFSASPIKNTLHLDLPGPILPFTSYTFEMQVQIPANAKPGDQICNTIALKTNYLDETSAELPLEIIESELACLTVAAPPCNLCGEIMRDKINYVLNPGTTNNASTPYVVKTGYVTFTTLKPIQEVNISISDLKYHFNKPECTDCKTPALSRGGIFPLSATQMLGTLEWDDYTGSSIPNFTSIDNLPQELIWKLGVVLQPGTYTIPFQITLPKGIIADCCDLIIENLNLKITLKDNECKICDQLVSPSTDTCCTGSYWKSKQMTWSLLNPDLPSRKVEKKTILNNEDQVELKNRIENNKLVMNGDIMESTLPLYGVTNIDCGKEYHIMEGGKRTFNASFSCNPNLPNCGSETLITIETISGDYINVVNQAMPYTKTFNLPGVYKIKFIGKCGGVVCNTCEYTLVVDKNCCANIIKKEPTKVRVNNFHNLPSTTHTLTYPPTPHYYAFSNATVNLNYSCTQGCATSYNWKRKRNGVTISSGSSSSPSISFAPPSFGEDLIEITPTCGTQNCTQYTERFYLGCKLCYIDFPIDIKEIDFP